MSRSRSERGAFAEVRITPHSESEMAPSCSRLTTPYPVTAVPGSMPRMIKSAPAAYASTRLSSSMSAFV
jgi:hypothetical protein